jgi:predicted O-methyltransferase YrrM
MKWYLANSVERFRFAIKNPRYVMGVAAREATLADERFLGKLTGVSAMQVRGFLQEPFEMPDFVSHLRSCEAVFREGMYSADFWAKKILIQYAAVRALRPEIIVETGVASGVSSSYLLLALERNKKGTLHSVEIGDPSYRPAGRVPGWIIPDRLRSRWQLHIGDATTVLPVLFQKLGEVDMFIHDSLHTYEHMKFELELAYPHTRKGGLLLADDALWNKAFDEVAQAVSSPGSRIIRGVGIMKK